MPHRAPPPFAAAALGGLLLLGGCFERPKPVVSEARLPVQVVRVAVRPSADTRTYSGIVKPRHTADVGFRAPGRITERLVDAGGRVKEGQVLARLDPADLVLSLRSAAAELEAAEAQETQAVAESGRSAVLVRQGHVSASDDDQKQSAARMARQRTLSARAALQLAQNRLAYSELLAPTDGVVLAVLADPGTVVAEGTPVLRLSGDDQAEVEVSVPETAVAALSGADATVTLWADPARVLHARLREVSPQADPGLRTYHARYTLDDPPDWLALGMTATLRLAAGGTGKVAELPSSAIVDRGAGPSVWLVDAASGRLSLAPVQVRALRQDTTVVSGLPDGALAVSLGVQKLDPAAQVRVADLRPAAD